jgi:hypothetical protein
MAKTNSSENNRARILGACRDLVMKNLPLPAAPGRQAALSGRKTRSEAAREPVVAWLPLSVSQNRLAAVIGKAKESEIFGLGRAWPSKNDFEDDLRMVIVQSSVHADGPVIAAAERFAGPIAESIQERQAQLTDVVRTMTQEFVVHITRSQPFLIGMSARSGIAATPREREAALAGEASELWKSVAERIRSSRNYYRSQYGSIAHRFGLAARDGLDPDDALTLFASLAATAADGLGQAAVYDTTYATNALEIEGESWSYLGYLVGLLLNQLFAIDGADPIPSLRDPRGIRMASVDTSVNDAVSARTD